MAYHFEDGKWNSFLSTLLFAQKWYLWLFFYSLCDDVCIKPTELLKHFCHLYCSSPGVTTIIMYSEHREEVNVRNWSIDSPLQVRVLKLCNKHGTGLDRVNLDYPQAYNRVSHAKLSQLKCLPVLVKPFSLHPTSRARIFQSEWISRLYEFWALVRASSSKKQDENRAPPRKCRLGKISLLLVCMSMILILFILYDFGKYYHGKYIHFCLCSVFFYSHIYMWCWLSHVFSPLFSDETVRKRVKWSLAKKGF